MARHSWEQYSWDHRQDDAFVDPHVEADEAFWGVASDSDDDETPAATPADLLVEKMLNLHLYNKISAEDCCVMMHYASLSGLKASAREILS